MRVLGFLFCLVWLNIEIKGKDLWVLFEDVLKNNSIVLNWECKIFE